MSAETVICTYRVKTGQEQAFMALLARHWPTLREHGLVTEAPPATYRRIDADHVELVEIFAWRDAEAPRYAHETPAIAAIWEPMATLCEERDGRPAMEFPHYTPIDVG